MKRTFRLPMLAGVIAAAVVVTSLAPDSPHAAQAQIMYRVNGRHYYSGGYARAYRGYSGYGYSQYGNGYSYYAPRAYVYLSYRPYGFGGGYGTAEMYGGTFDPRFGRSYFYGRPYRPAYTPYGYGGYGPFGY